MNGLSPMAEAVCTDSIGGGGEVAAGLFVLVTGVTIPCAWAATATNASDVVPRIFEITPEPHGLESTRIGITRFSLYRRSQPPTRFPAIFESTSRVRDE